MARECLLDLAKEIVGLETAKLGSGPFVNEEQRSRMVVKASDEFRQLNALSARFDLADKEWGPALFEEAKRQIKEIDTVIALPP